MWAGSKGGNQGRPVTLDQPASNPSWPEQARKDSSDQNLERAAAGKATGPQLTSRVCQGEAEFSACLPVSCQGFPLAKPYWEVEDEGARLMGLHQLPGAQSRVERWGMDLEG